MDKINLIVEDKDRIGLIGVNGAGKSTLLNIINGELDFEEGERDLSKDLTIGFLKQNTGLDANNTIIKELKSVFNDVNNALEEMHSIEKQMANINHSSEEYNQLLNNYTSLQAFIDAKDGYNIDVKISIILTGMGFSDKSNDTCKCGCDKKNSRGS